MTFTFLYIIVILLPHEYFIHLVVGKVYYIKPLTHMSCLEESCLTLLQFAAYTDSYLETNVSLSFLPGNHSLNSDLHVNAVSRLSMYLNSTLSPATPTIVCEEQASITFSSIDDVYIGYLKFVGCHGHQVTSVKTFMLESATFIYHTGSALQFSSSNANIVRSLFISNSGGSYHQRSAKLKEDNYPLPDKVTYTKAGAAMTLAKSSVDIMDCLFEGNHAPIGGAIFSELHSNITLINTMFKENYAVCGTRDNIDSACIGGALYSANGTVMAYNSTFFGNKVITIRGEYKNRIFPFGGVFGLLDSIFIAKNCNFVQNGLDHLSAKSYGGVIHAYNTTLNISNSSFMNNSNASFGGTVSISSAICFVTHSNFTNNSAIKHGGAIYSETSSITIFNSEFKYNLNSESSVATNGGGVLYTWQASVSITNSVFEKNKGNCGGVIVVKGDGYIAVTNSNFSRNHATMLGGVIHMEVLGVRHIVTIVIASSSFSNNSAGRYGGGIHVSKCNTGSITLNGTEFLRNKASVGGAIFLLYAMPLFISNSKFVENAAENGGAIICFSVSNVTIEGGTIESNTAHIGVVYFASGTAINFFGTVIRNNTANRAVVYISQSVGYLSDIRLTGNTGSIFVYFGNLTLSGAVSIINGSSQLNSNKIMTFQEGGAVTAIQASVAIVGVCSLSNNFAESGGALYVIESRIHIYGEATIANNTAFNSGGGIYMHQSGLKCYSQCIFWLVNNTSSYKGGGIYASSSYVSAENEAWVTFKENYANFAGGGVCLEQSSKLYVLMILADIGEYDTITFRNNSADYGGAVYVADETNSGTCASESLELYLPKTECFIELLPQQSGYFGNINIGVMVFTDNHAYISGSDLFGGLLDRCTIIPLAEKGSDQPYNIDGASYFLDVSRIEQLETISSAPIRICFCNEDKQSDCSYHPPVVNVKKGETFTVSLVAVDHVNKTVSNVTIHSSLSSSLGGLGENRQNQSTGEDCTDLMFEVFSPHKSEQLILYADGPCKDAPLSQGIVNINFSSCDCPIGFQQNVAMKTNCQCECNSDLHPYVSNCNPEAETISREGDFWVDFVEESRSFFIHPHCPLDYCKPSNKIVEINLNNNSGADAQCANNRSGILCGRCSFGTSLSISSSHCIKCPTYWPLLTVIFLVVSVLAGILLVALVLWLNLTVAVGTLNGVIFYANIVAANTNSVFPPNVIIAWLNLEPGINICFFNGMTTYWKTWLQLVFPAYVIFLVALVILISKKSIRFSMLIGRKDPVATLATLLFFSYAKLLHTIIASLSGAVLKYPGINGIEDRVVWLPDATIKYLSGKHIPLFIVAILILLVGIAYTTILFSWQWLVSFKIFNYSPKLSLFIQTYNVPYTPKHRYWTGLLLIARIILYIIFSANIKGDPKINLIAIGIVVASILIVKDFVEGDDQLYQKQLIEILEIVCHFNLVILCIVSSFTLEDKTVKNLFAQISMSITIVLLLGVLLYHFFTEGVFKTKLWKHYKKDQRQLLMSDTTNIATIEDNVSTPSRSVIEGPKQPSILHRGRKGGRLSKKDSTCELKEILLDKDDAQYM